MTKTVRWLKTTPPIVPLSDLCAKQLQSNVQVRLSNSFPGERGAAAPFCQNGSVQAPRFRADGVQLFAKPGEPAATGGRHGQSDGGGIPLEPFGSNGDARLLLHGQGANWDVWFDCCSSRSADWRRGIHVRWRDGPTDPAADHQTRRNCGRDLARNGLRCLQNR